MPLTEQITEAAAIFAVMVFGFPAFYLLTEWWAI